MNTQTRHSLAAALVWISALALFWNSLGWLAAAAFTRDQLGHAALVLIFGLVLILRDRRSPRPVFRFERIGLGFLLAACLLAAAAGFFHNPVPVILGMGALAGAALLFIRGDAVWPTATGLAFAFSGLTVLAVFIPVADWPLRLLAGQLAAWMLALLGSPGSLVLAGTPPKLLLFHGERAFEVAPECNGFGIIGGCILLATLMAFSRRLSLPAKVASLVLAPVIGLFSNALRIIIIVLLAPLAKGHYFLMHEIVGTALFVGTLALLWKMVTRLPGSKRFREPSPDQTNSAIS